MIQTSPLHSFTKMLLVSKRYPGVAAEEHLEGHQTVDGHLWKEREEEGERREEKGEEGETDKKEEGERFW